MADADAVALEQLIAALRSGGLDFAAPPKETRAAFETTLSQLPVAEDIDFSRTQLGGVPTLVARSPGAARHAALLYIHGGAFIAGSAHGYRSLAGELGRAARATTYAIDYRLAPERPFPAAIEDAVAAYQALLESGLSPKRIVIAGDSAGGGLTISMLLKLRDGGAPLPAAAVIISPWADLACDTESYSTKRAEDPSLTPEGLRASAAHYLGKADARDPLASPARAHLAGLPPLLIQVGSSEILFDDAVRLAGAAGAAGVAVRLDVWPRMVHVWHAFAFMLDAGRRAIADAGGFMQHALAGGR